MVFVGKRKISELNEHFLSHKGPTDVITFDYSKEFIPFPGNGLQVIGEIFICVAIAAEASKQCGRDTSEEVVLYIVHAILHLCGFSDTDEKNIGLMREAERVLISRLSKKFSLRNLFVN